MRTFRLNKLVRDGIVPSMQAMGQKVKWRKLSGAEFLREAARKVAEETGEFDAEKADVKELADVIEAAEAVVTAAKAMAAELGASPEELEAVQIKRRKERGGFTDRTYVETVSMADTDKWADYYASDPKRFPEIKE